MQQLSLIALPKKSHQPRRVMMHYIDIGLGADTKVWVEFKCVKCGSTEEHEEMFGDVKIRRGVPCPTCNSKEKNNV